MVDVNNTEMISSSDFRKLIDARDLPKLDGLVSKLKLGESGQHRAIGAGRHPGFGGRAGGNDGVDISREVAQGWLDDGTLHLRTDLNGSMAARLNMKPVDEELVRLGLKRPE